MDLEISEPADAQGAYASIWPPLRDFNERVVGDASGEPFALVITRPGSSDVVGGLWGMSLWGSFFIAAVVTPEGSRGHGLGTELMRRAEAAARARGCREMWLDTYAFQARPYYERLGFSVFAQLEGPAPIFPHYFMRKALA